jgi:hypothetical protein
MQEVGSLASRSGGGWNEQKAHPGVIEGEKTEGGELEQIQFLLGHVSVQTTERYLGCRQRIRGAVNDRIGIEP